MKNGQILTLIVLAAIIILFYTLFVYGLGFNRGLRQAEDASELALEAAAQSYKNALPNDSTKYDTYGNERFQKKASPYVLPENARTKAANPKAPLYEKSEHLRKRTF